MARHPNERPVASLPRELRRTSVPPPVRAWVARETGAAVVRTARLRGASTSAMHRVDLANGERVVLRRYVWPGFLEAEPDAPVREVDALGFAASNGLVVPEVVAADATGAAIGDGVPAVLMSFVAGQSVAAPDLATLANTAAAVHAIAADAFAHGFGPWYADVARVPPATTQPRLWERALAIWQTPPRFGPCFVHRDFHPGNVLWQRGTVSGVVDWVNACRGPAGCDVAHCRANLRSLASDAAAEAFVSAYRSVTGADLDPYWIVASYMEHDPDEWTVAQLAADEPDLARAVASISA